MSSLQNPQAAIELLDRLIAFNTISHRSNLEMIDFIRTYLGSLGIESHLDYAPDREKANLYATIGRTDIGGILLSGHTDVVPIEHQDWHSDPFAMIEREGNLYGRGTADMKGFIAVVLAMLPELLRRNVHIPVHLCFSYDEEVGCVGVRSLIAQLKDAPVRPRMCIVGEPTEMQVVIAHKGKQYLRAHIHGAECHSSLSPHGVNAIEFASRLVCYMTDIGMRLKTEGPTDYDFDVPHTTVMTGIIHGGTNLNIVPNYCWFDFEIRDLPRHDPWSIFEKIRQYADSSLQPAMRAVNPVARIDFEEVSLRPNLDTQPEEEVVRITKALAERNDHGKVAFGTEAALFQKHAGIPTVVCGPGSIGQAHKPDEYVSIDQIALCERFFQRFMDTVCVQ
jgi:acetylornithine deacetylase